MVFDKMIKLFVVDSHSQEMESLTKNDSKSLSASPTETPDNSSKTDRKIHVNRSFTSPFVLDEEKYEGKWILAAILQQSRVNITAKTEEEDKVMANIEQNKPLNRREMNLLSPTSM